MRGFFVLNISTNTQFRGSDETWFQSFLIPELKVKKIVPLLKSPHHLYTYTCIPKDNRNSSFYRLKGNLRLFLAVSPAALQNGVLQFIHMSSAVAMR